MDTNGKYFYEYSVERLGEIVSNIHLDESQNLDIKLTYYIGGIKYTPDEVNEFVLISARYHDFKIRFTFLEKPNHDYEFKLFLRYYIINNIDRKLLAQSIVVTKINIDINLLPLHVYLITFINYIFCYNK